MEKATLTKALYIVDRLIEKGWTPIQTFAMVGNDIQESLLIPAIVGDKNLSDAAHGISQWRASRFENLQAFAKDRKKPWEDLDVQIDFKDFELTSGEEKRAGKAIRAATDLEEATAAAIGYYRPKGWTLKEPKKGHGWKNRLNNARAVKEAFEARSATPEASKPGNASTLALVAPMTEKNFNETSLSIRDIQTALKAAGFDPGPVDGIPGRQTLTAVKAFQERNGLDVDGVVGPKTLLILLPKAKSSALAPLPWIVVAQAKKGLTENKNKKALAAFLKSDGNTLGDPAVLPWCGDFVETCIAITLPKETLPGNPYLARNWLKFGIPLSAPTFGAVMVFWRGSKAGTSGHVAFYISETATHYLVLGGNQSNSVSEVLIEKSRLLGARWPKSVALPKTGAIIKKASAPVSSNEA